MLRSIVMICSLLLCASLHARQKVLDPTKSISQYSLKAWTTDDGLPSISITDIVQADSQYIWIATYNGLSRFDGVNFTNYSIDNVEEMHSNAITTLEYHQQELWIGTHKGILKYRDGNFLEDDDLIELKASSIEKLEFDSQNRLWIGTTSEGLYVYDRGKLTKLRHPILDKSQINAIAEDKSGTIWIGADKGELFKYQGSELVLAYQSEMTDGISTLYLDKLGVVWMVADKGIFTISNGLIAQNKSLSQSGNYGSIIQDDYGNVWTTNDEGMLRYDHITNNTETFTEEKGLPNNLIRKLMFDHQGNLWVASYRSGLFQLTDGVFTNYSETEGLSDNVVTSVIEHEDNTYWIATEDGNIDLLESGKLKPFKKSSELPSGRLKHLMKDREGNVWVSTYGGLMKLNSKGEQLPLPEQVKQLDSYVRRTFEDKEGNIWIGTRRTGVYRLTKEGNIKHFAIRHGLASNFIMSLNQSANGNILVGTKNGINIIKDDKIIDTIDSEDGMPTNFVFDICEDENKLWIGTNLGLCLYDPNRENVVLYNAGNGLKENIVFDIATDSSNNFWMTSNSGLIQANKHELMAYADGTKNSIQVKLYSKSDGMRSEQCVGAVNMLKDSEGKLWIPTIAGVATIHPEKQIADELVKYSRIENLKTDINGYEAKQGIIIEPDEGKRIRISFTAFNYVAPSKIDFQYRILPFDETWRTITDARHVDFTNLPPDDYTFQVKTNLDDNPNPKTISSLKFTIEAHFYQTVWFYVAWVFLIFFVAYLSYRYRINQMRINEAKLQERVAERTREVVEQRDQLQQQREKIQLSFNDLKEAQLQLVESEKMASLGQLTAGVAHELNNPINFVFAGIDSLKTQVNDLLEVVTLYEQLDTEADEGKIAEVKAEIKELKEELEFEELPEDIRGLVDDIQQGAERTAEIVKSLKVFTRIDDGQSLHLTDLHNVLNSTLIILRNTYKDIVTVDRKFHELPMVTCNVGKMSQVFTNIIANAVDAIDGKGTITIETLNFDPKEDARFDEDMGYVEVRVTDTGEGMTEDELTKIFQPFFTTKDVGKGTGLGLSISKDIIDKHHGDILVASEKGKGSTFRIIIPIEQHGIVEE